MQQDRVMGGEVSAKESRTDLSASLALPLDAQLADLIETVWACERQWKVDDRINAAIRYER